MGRAAPVGLPKLRRILEEMGENIRLARLRRDITAQQLAERADISRTTLRLIERGNENVSLGSYASVLFCLGLERDLGLVGRDDEFGRKLQDAGLGAGREGRKRATSKGGSGLKEIPVYAGWAPPK